MTIRNESGKTRSSKIQPHAAKSDYSRAIFSDTADIGQVTGVLLDGHNHVIAELVMRKSPSNGIATDYEFRIAGNEDRYIGRVEVKESPTLSAYIEENAQQLHEELVGALRAQVRNRRQLHSAQEQQAMARG